MSDQELRAYEKAWQADPRDDAALDRFLLALIRAGRDPVDGIAVPVAVELVAPLAPVGPML